MSIKQIFVLDMITTSLQEQIEIFQYTCFAWLVELVITFFSEKKVLMEEIASETYSLDFFPMLPPSWVL